MDGAHAPVRGMRRPHFRFAGLAIDVLRKPLGGHGQELAQTWKRNLSNARRPEGLTWILNDVDQCSAPNEHALKLRESPHGGVVHFVLFVRQDDFRALGRSSFEERLRLAWVLDSPGGARSRQLV